MAVIKLQCLNPDAFHLWSGTGLSDSKKTQRIFNKIEEFLYSEVLGFFKLQHFFPLFCLFVCSENCFVATLLTPG